MLKKLFKHEWKDSWKMVGIMNIAVLVFSFLGALIFNEDIVLLADTNEYVMLAIVFYIVFYIAAIIALSLCTGFYFYYRFFKNFYTDEGYLLHTLPVTPHQLIWSKTFVALIWQLISGLVVTFSIINFVNYVMISSGEESIWINLGELFGLLLSRIEGYTIPFYIIIILYCVIVPFFSIFLGYASISLGQCTKKHKLLAAVGIYLGITSLIQVVTSFITVTITVWLDAVSGNTVEEMFMNMTLFYGVVVLIMGAATALFYFLSYNTMKNRLNLE